MRLDGLTVTNWKCFASKREFNFEQHQLVKSANGTGKTSMFEAILYALTGSAPPGFNLNTVRNDDSKPAEVELYFTMGKSKCEIKRSFGGKASLAHLVVDGELEADGARALQQWVSQHVHLKVLDALWTSSLITSDALSVSFFTDAILENELHDAKVVLAALKGENYRLNRELQHLQSMDLVDLEMVQLRMQQVKKELQGANVVSEAKLAAALAAKQAVQELDKIKEKMGELNLDGINLSRLERLILDKEKVEKQLLEEEAKKESVWSKLSAKELEIASALSLKGGVCVLCGAKFDENHAMELQNNIKSSGRSERLVQQLRADVELANLCTMEQLQLWKDRNNANFAISKCPDWMKVLEQHNERVNELWKELNKLQKDEAVGIQQKVQMDHIHEVRKKVEANKQKIAAIQEWLESAVQSWTQQLVAKAGALLHGMNNRYQQVCIQGKEFAVVVEDADMVLHLLPVVRLSNGERTLVALSLLFAMHDLFVPEVPLLFDETFVALDQENLHQVQRFLRMQEWTQIFVITHDQNWSEL